MARRQLTDAQKVLLGREIEPDIRAVAAARQGTRTDLGTSGTLVPEVERTRDEVAATVGLGSGRTYERAKQVIEEAEQQPDAPELIERIESSSMDLPGFLAQLRLWNLSREYRLRPYVRENWTYGGLVAGVAALHSGFVHRGEI